MKRFILFILLLVISNKFDLFSQKEFNNWYFGNNAGITFNTKSGEPEALTDGVLYSQRGCAAISDNAGHLLFYTNGVTVYNRLHQIMANGDDLFGSWSSSQSAIIVPKPGSNCIYYIFTASVAYFYDTIPNAHFFTEGFNYSIVDMSYENGLGAVIHKNIRLLDSNSEAQAAVGHKNGHDVWIVTQDMNEHCLKSYLLTQDGLLSEPVKSPCDIDLTTYHYFPDQLNYHRWGLMKISPNGKKIVVSGYFGTQIFLYNFDDATGIISNEIKFSGPANTSFGVEFSGNNQYLYISFINLDKNYNPITTYLYQYDITSHDPVNIKGSETLIYELSNDTQFFGLQMGPNGKIYMARNNMYLSVIHQPNLPGKACGFILDDLYLNKKSSDYGLPSVVQRYTPKDGICSAVFNLSVCERDSIILFPEHINNANYEWTGPNGFKSSVYNPVILNAKPEMSGLYKCQLNIDGNLMQGTTYNVTVYQSPKILFVDSSELILCANSYILKAVEDPSDTKFTWYGIKSNKNNVTITQSGTYKVVVKNLQGCLDSATIKIKLYPPYCEGDTIFLNPDYYPNAVYSWSGPKGFVSADKNPVIPNSTVDMTGDYNIRIIVKDTVTKKSDTINTKIPVIVNPREKIIFSGRKKITDCKDSLELYAVKNPDGCKITWKGIDSHENKVTIKSNGIYSVFVENQFGCIDSATVEIKLNQIIDVKILSDNGNRLCKGENVRLYANDNFADYLWSTGDTTSEINITQAGIYKLQVKSQSGCEGADSIIIEEFEKPQIAFDKSVYTICKGDSIVLNPIEVNLENEYIWSDGLKKSERVVKDNADLFLIVKSPNGCTDTAFVKVLSLEIPNSKITAEKTEACFGEKITLKADNFNPDYDYLWSTGEKDESIIVSQSGKYKLIVSNKNLCYDSFFINVIIYPELNLELTSDKTILCYNDSIILGSKSKYYKYLWSTGDTTETLKVDEAGIYQLIVQNNIDCIDTAQIEILKYNAELISVPENLNFNDLCIGSAKTKIKKFTLKSDFDFSISNIYFKSKLFSITDINSYFKSYKDGDSFEIPVIFKPLDAGIFADTLVIESDNPCIYNKEIPITGSAKALFRFSLPNIISQAGNYLMIPINAAMTCPNSNKLNSDYEIEISFDKEYFLPDSVKFGDLIENKIENQNRILIIKGITEFNEKKDTLLPINYIYGMALVGRKDTIPLTIDYVNFINKRYYPEYLNGSLKIEG